MKREQNIFISDYFKEPLALFLDCSDRDEALKRLIDCLDQQGKLHDKEAFFKAILERERIVSTGIGMGVAIPHAKLKGYNEFFIAVGVQQGKGIEWNALDQLPVRLIFLIGGPDNCQNDYLKILSQLTLVIRDEQKRKKLIKAATPAELITLLKEQGHGSRG